MAASDWNAVAYEELADPMTRWGAGFLASLEFDGGETVLDAGCGTGRVTELLLERLPRGTVLAVDASPAMVEAAAERFAGDDRVRVGCQDLLELEVGEPVDVVFSTATFHWIKDHARLFRRLAGVLKPGGLLAAQCGGLGNLGRVWEAAREVMREERYRVAFEGWESRKEFPSPETTRDRLEDAGFGEVEAWLQEEPTPFDSVEKLARYLGTVILRHHLEVLPDEDREPFCRAVAGRLAENGPPVADYVRLNMIAYKTRNEERA